jgi:uncharacterized metal-binding protein YceD (DUF177 family)
MRFKINEIGPDGLPLEVEVTTEWLATACPDLGARPGPAGLKLRGQIGRSGDDYLLRADLRGQLETTCARCLEPARISLDLPMVVTFIPAEADKSEDPDVVLFAGGEIDLSNEVRDEIALAVPINPVCDEACRGLCSICGGNRNVSACTCEADATTRFGPSGTAGRFAALGKIKL